jgi:hypothetical protein
MAAVVSTVLLVTGLTTLLHMFCGTRLPLVQGPSFVYLAPALVIIHSPEFFGLNDNVCICFCLSNSTAVAMARHMMTLTYLHLSLQNFKHIMKHLQGAIIIGGTFQVLLGYTGLMSQFLRCVSFAVNESCFLVDMWTVTDLNYDVTLDALFGWHTLLGNKCSCELSFSMPNISPSMDHLLHFLNQSFTLGYSVNNA